jgi:uncharacterized protein (TIGR00251 family)
MLKSLVRSMSKSAKNKKQPAKPPPINPGPIYTDKNGNLIILVNAKPGSKQTQITDISEDGVGIQIAAPPIDGEANTELIKFLAKLLSLRKSDVSLDKGNKSRQKQIVIGKGCLEEEKLKELIKSAVD